MAVVAARSFGLHPLSVSEFCRLTAARQKVHVTLCFIGQSEPAPFDLLPVQPYGRVSSRGSRLSTFSRLSPVVLRILAARLHDLTNAGGRKKLRLNVTTDLDCSNRGEPCLKIPPERKRTSEVPKLCVAAARDK